MSALVKLLLFFLTVLAALSSVASPTVAVNRHSGFVATMSLGPVATKAELMEVGGASMRRSRFENGYDGVRLPQAALFSGSFAAPVTGTWTTLSNGAQRYSVAGVFINGLEVLPVRPAKVQLVSNTDNSLSDGLITATGGYSYVGSVPEPSMLIMVGTGLITVLTKARQKFS